MVGENTNHEQTPTKGNMVGENTNHGKYGW